jgi:hypothetical protein
MSRVLRALWMALVAGGALWLTGCYSYVPLRGAPTAVQEVQQGTALKIHFSRPIQVEMGERGANDVVELDAEMIRVEGDSLALSVFQATSQSGYQQQVRGRTARVPLDAISGMEIRRFSAAKTILAGAFVVGAAIAAAAVLSSSGGSPGGSKPPPPSQ